MMEQKKNKSLIVGIIAAVVILAVLLALVLTQCTGDTGGQVTTAPVETQEEIPTYTLYWNPDRELYAGKTEAGLSSRVPENDGYFHIRFLCNGEEITLQTQDRQMVNMIDTRDLMGLEFDEDGYIIGVVDPRDMPLEMPGYLFFVQSVGGNVIKVNSSDAFDGMDILLEATENTGIWDMTGISGPEGVDAEPIVFDRLICVQNMAGELTHVYIIERSNYFLTHEAECQHCKETVTWYEWTRETDLPTRTGHYQLMKDVQLESQHSMKAKVALCLDLNGHTIDGMRNARVISLQKTETELALMDTSEEKTGRIAGHGTTGQGGVIWVRNGNFYMYGGTLDASDVIGTNGVVSMVDSNRYFYLYDGTIIGGIARAQAMETTASGFGYGAGGALYIRGTMRMYGGTIRDGRAEAGYNYKNGKLTVNRGIGGNIFLNSGAEFEIQDGQILNGYAGNMGGNIYADGTAEIIISGGNISGGRNDSRVKGRHGGNIVTATKTTVQMSGGTISGGVNPTGAGGNLNLNGTMTMTGGVITGGRGTDGGNIHMGNRAVLNMYGGVISGGCAENYGGNVNVSGQSTLCLQGGAILGGVADNSGGNINCFSEGTFRMTAGTLSDGVAKGEASGNGGGNIYLRADKTKVEIFGGTISGGKAEGAVAEDGTVTGGYGGNINISRGIVNISGGVITGGEANGYAGGIYVGTKSSGMTLSGNARIYGNGIDIVRSTSNTAGKSQIVIDGWKGNGDKGKLVIDRIKGVAGSVLAIPVEGEALTDETLELFDSARRFLPLGINDKGQMILAKTLEMGEGDHTHCLCGGAIKDHGCADTGFISVTAAEFMECFSYHDSAYYALGNANLCLTEDIELNAPCFSAGFELNICLNGHKITATKNGRLTSNGTTGVMNLADCTGKGSVVADSSCTTSLMTTYKGVLNIYGGTYDASAIKLDMTKDNSVGAAVAVREETDSFTLYGGKIIGGEANRGGTVYAYKGSVKICGGEITGGIARNGGNVAVNYGSLEVLGGKIYGGKADSGAGVHIGANASVKTLLLSGDAMIYGNGTEDVYLGSATGSDNYLTLDGWNGNGENAALKLNCRAAGIGSVVAVAKEGVLTEEDLAKLSYISDTLTAELKDGKIVLTYVTDHEHCLCNDTMEHTCEKVRYMKIATAEEFKALFDKDNFLLGDTNVVLTGDITLDSQYYSNGHIWNLCLNGHTLTMTEKARLTANKISGVLNITDCGEAGKILAAEGCRETLVNTNSGIVNLYGGIIDASAIRLGTEGSTVGAAVSIGQAVDQFNMYGGKLVGGQVSRGGTLYIYKGSAKIYGGEITGGEAANGGNVSVNYGSVEVLGGEIYGGKADSGAGVHIGANASVKTLLLSGDAMIYGNGTEDVYLGSATAAHNYLTLDGWKGNGENGALVLGCRGAAADSVVAVAKEGELTQADAAKIIYSDENLISELAEGKLVLRAYHRHCLCANTLQEGCDHSKLIFTEIASADAFLEAVLAEGTETVNIVLTESFTLTGSQYIKGKTVNLCLNGQTLTMSGAKLIEQDGAVLNITTCNGGEITAGTTTSRQMLYAYTGGGTVNLYAGTINASKINTSGTGAAVQVKNNSTKEPISTFNMYGGTIIGAKAVERGTVYVDSGRFRMYGGEIKNGHATNGGGGVCVRTGHAELMGGIITGCSTNAANLGGGVCMLIESDSLTLSGNMKIYGNTSAGNPDDVYVGNKNKSAFYMVMDNWAGNGVDANGDPVKLYVSVHKDKKAGDVVAQAKSGSLTAAQLDMLEASGDVFMLALKDGKIVLADGHAHCLCNGTQEHTCTELTFRKVGSADAFKAFFGGDNKLMADTNMVLTADLTLDASYASGGHVWNLCLNGFSITLTNGGKLAEDCKVINCALADSVTQQVDLIMFMGQSNMAGRGDATQSVTVPAGYGYEFRAISDPTKLYPITEPFGVNENNVQSGVTETSKTGSMVSAFVKAYYEANQIPVVAVSCSKGGTGLEFWKVNGNALNDAVARHEAAKNWLHANAYTVGNDFMVWCQGETDGGDGMSAENYANGLKGIIEEMITETGIDFCAVVRIGNARNDAARHAQIIKAQTQLCKSYDKAVLVSAKLAGYGADMMKDAYHYLQAAYNEVGADAGTNAASYVKTGIEPSMKDPQYNNNYPADDIPEEENVNALEFTFDSETENGLLLSAIGTVADGALTVTDATNGSKNGILLPADKQFTISPDKSFTLEFVTTGTEGVVLLGSGSSTGGFVYFSPAGASKLRLRFDSSSKQFDATTQAVSATAKTHIAIVYDADTKTLSMYQDGKALTVKGNMSNFGTISFTTLCGGYKHNVETYAYAGQLHYFRYIDQALTVEEFHKES